ncbi:peroxiredoxin family protein [Georgenia sp. TF02-10]|uniref:peroxiredoxin family protein n=1 Tax=Georgenia sp. TF02-10 TaxID=2917725 RepID=UPI001FA7D2CF|nr:peroxiredoxin family protein [Georgenia sp. TF02-10]UNX53321.1 peroxiredoxin family protein [Georgenia sp. TF02-10]
MTSTTLSAKDRLRHKHAEEKARAQAAASKARRRRILGICALLAVVAAAVYALATSGTASSEETRRAPDFTLPTTAGTSVTLSELRGEPVILYFNEGAGCASCTVQMAEIEKEPGFAEAGITVLPIVMNTAEQIRPDMQRYGATTPYLLDDGTVSQAYGTLGTGMHPGVPGHGFVLIDADGNQVWQGDYPSMWFAPADLLDEAESRLR